MRKILSIFSRCFSGFRSEIDTLKHSFKATCNSDVDVDEVVNDNDDNGEGYSRRHSWLYILIRCTAFCGRIGTRNGRTHTFLNVGIDDVGMDSDDAEASSATLITFSCCAWR